MSVEKICSNYETMKKQDIDFCGYDEEPVSECFTHSTHKQEDEDIETLIHRYLG